MKNPLATITVEEQFHISMIALGGMMLMTIATTIYLVGWVTHSWVFRGFIILNALFGIMFLASMLATSFQQFQMYKAATAGMQNLDSLKNIFGDVKGGNANG